VKPLGHACFREIGLLRLIFLSRMIDHRAAAMVGAFDGIVA
jgi:hypothetical protein